MTDKPYHSFETEDFLADDDFLRYVKFSFPQDIFFWEEWKLRNPLNLASFNEARMQLQLILSDAEIPVPTDFKEDLLKDINTTINYFERDRKRKLFNRVGLASIASLLLIGAFIGWYSISTITIRADYGQNRLVHLPDGTEIILNANSTLSYPRALAWKSTRAVDLDGEAYFKVKHLNVTPNQIQSGEIFIANTNGVAVQVLGTEFNLKERRNLINVTLVKGRIQVRSKITGKHYILKPGELLDFDKKGLEVRTGIPLETQTAWVSGKIIVNQTKVSDILKQFEDLYGYNVVLDSPALGDKKIDGTISIRSEESLLFTLKNILNVDIKKEGKTIYLKNRN